MDKFKKTIAIDFDGVIHKYSKGWQDGEIYDEPVEGALEAIVELLIKGYKVSIFTTREHPAVVKNWIIDKMYKCKEIEGKPFYQENFEVTNKKPIAIAYIDDRGIRFTNWKDMLNYF
ncbi:unnamed protein product [marine sediment metagenome]|uniref:FCP1 homology domain-containing protein n=1 Tax=marine sediment metagenome TaxID=412755 RepID=X1S9J5_9ZZZZ